MARQQLWHLLRMFLRQPGAAFDVGEEEGDGAGRELVLVSHLNHDYDIAAPFWKPGVKVTVTWLPLEIAQGDCHFFSGIV